MKNGRGSLINTLCLALMHATILRSSETAEVMHRWRNPVRIVRAPMSSCVNHRKFNGRPSLRVPPGSFDSKYYVYVYYYTANRRLYMGVPPYSYQNCVGTLPPQVKYCGGACPPAPPGSAAYVMYNHRKSRRKSLECFGSNTSEEWLWVLN